MIQANNINKPFVQFVAGGFSGCRAFRCSFPAYNMAWLEGLGIHPIETPFPLMDAQMLSLTRVFVLKSINGWQGLEMVKTLKAAQQKFGFKIIADYDDQPCQIEGSFGLPWKPWGPEAKPHTEEDDKPFIEIANLVDKVIVTNDYMARKLNEVTRSNNYVVIPNTVPRYLFSAAKKQPIDKDKTQFTIVGSGCPLHSMAPHKDPATGADVPGDKGDWASAEWDEFIRQGVKDGYIRYIQLGNQNWLFNDMQDKIQTFGWLPPLKYPSFISKLNADVVIAPLVDNVFNKCKSDLRAIESQICSSVLMGSVFPESPYSNVHELSRIPQGFTAAQLKERLFEIGKRDNWNSMVEWGWKDLYENARITEMEEAVDRYMRLFVEAPKGQVSFDLL